MFSTGICRWLFLLVSLATWVTLTNSREMRVVCYYTNWSVYRPGDAKFSPQNINPYLCTHLIYAFGGFTKDNTIKPFDKYQDIEKGGYAKFTGLKTYNKNLKTMLAIGGWNEGSTRFSSMVASPERRKEFAKNAIKFLRLNHFDGLDLDWEYPSFRDGGKPRDKDNYSLLVQDLREEFDKEAEKTGRPRLLLTMAVPAGIEYINKGFDVPKISRYVDWMNILSYDYHSAFEPSVNHHAPLYSLEEESEYNYDSDLNIHYSIQHYLNNGADPSKLVVGIPTYGRSYTLLNPDAVDIGSPADGPGNMGEATRENGYLAYYEICENVRDHDWEVEQPNSEVMGPFAFKDDQWVGYDDEEIVKKKAEYVAEHNLGGIMFWSIDNDDFRGKCHDKPYPLIEAGRAALLAAHGVTDDNLIAPTKKPLKSRTRTRTKTSNVAVSSKDEKTEKPEKLQTRRRNRPRPSKSKQESEQETTTVRKTRRKDSKDLSTQETSSYSSLKVVTPSYTTPAPPPTPDMDGDFKCEDDGFYPHPKDCKKYYWCLSGAGDTGIIAHQFTCPAGLYFNKAADSCDYTQNVVCNKKTQKATTANQGIAPGSTTSAPSSSFFSTSRVPPKITAATSKTTFVQTTTTTTEAYEEDDEEYEDEEDEHSKKGAEEDPQVIKELIELIKKAGGLEELEKQFNTKANVTNNSEQPKTKSSLSKTLYERVLSKAIKNTPTTTPSQSTKSRNSLFRNSRGPQSEKTEDDDESTTQKKSERGKLQYTSVSRFRPSVSRDKEIEENLEDDQEIEQKTESQTGRKVTDKFPAYTNIRRSRVSTTTKTPKNDRNKILGEGPVDEDDEVEKLIDDDEDEDEDETDSINDSTTKKTNIPQYVNIRRQRPSTTEEIPTSRYSEIRRGTTSTEEVPTSRYSEIRRGTTSTEAPISTSTTSKYKQIRRGTTTATTKKPFTEETQFLSSNITQEVIPVTEPVSSESGLGSTISDKPSNDTSEDSRNENLLNVITTTRTYISTTDDINFVKSEANETKSTEKPNLPSKPNLFNPIQRKRPQLFEPRPFSKPTEASTKSPASQTTKEPFKAFLRGSANRRTAFPKRTQNTNITSTPPTTTKVPSPFPSRFSRPTGPSRRKYLTRTTTIKSLESQDITTSTTTKPSSSPSSSLLRRPFLRRPLRPSITTKILGSVISPDQNIPHELYTTDKPIEVKDESVTNRHTENISLTAPPIEYNSIDVTEPDDLIISDVISTTVQPRRSTATPPHPSLTSTRSKVYSTSRTSPLRPAIKHTIANTSPYQTDLFSRIRPSNNLYQTHQSYSLNPAVIIDQLPAQTKVLLHSNGLIECLDQGNFPHPASCKKFISCSKTENGKMIGWEYTCPKNLSFDPIGGICNWSTDVSCDVN